MLTDAGGLECKFPYHRSVELLGGVVVIVLVSSPVARVGEKAPVCGGDTTGVATKVPLWGGTIKL